MKKIILMLALACGGCISHCGHGELDVVVIGQPKAIIKENNIICKNKQLLDMSLGVMRNGVGSMSTQDKIYWIINKNDEVLLQSAIKEGKLVEITYDSYRMSTFCEPCETISNVRIL